MRSIAHPTGENKIGNSTDVLEFYLGLKFTRKEVADILGISLRTVGTLIKEYGLKSRDKYNQMNDEELDEMMELVVLENPNSGYNFIHGHLESVGVIVN